jgi:oligoendopeptidase F
MRRRPRRAGLEVLHETNGEVWEQVVLGYEQLTERLSHLSSYVGCLAAADARDPRYGLAEARGSTSSARGMREALHRATASARRAPRSRSSTRSSARPAISHAAYALGRLRIEAKTSMASDLEALSADLGTDGIMAWGRLYDTISGRLTFPMVWPDGRREQLPVSQRRSLMADADRAVRRAAFEGGNQAWELGQRRARRGAEPHRGDAAHAQRAARGRPLPRRRAPPGWGSRGRPSTPCSRRSPIARSSRAAASG